MRSLAQALRRVDQDRADLRRGGSNFHYANMARWKQRLEIAPNNLHFDDLRSELNLEPIFNWRSIYGYPAMSLQSTSSLLLSSAILLPESLQLDSTLKGAVRWPLKPTQSAFIDRIEQTNQACTVIGWAVDPDIRDACGVIAFQDGRFIAGQNGHTMERQDVNAALNLAPGTQVGFTLVLPPQTRLGSLSIIAAGVNSIAEVPKAAAVVYSEADSDRVQPAIPVSGLRVPSKDPLFAFPQGSPFGGIYSFRRDFDPRQSAGVTAQFPEEAATYHRKYTAHDYWRSLLCTALERSQIDIRSIRSVLDTGCGSGNTVFPALSVFPHASIVATDISPQLLTVLRNQLSEKDRNRCVCIAMDASERRFEEGAFDVVIGGAILHHIPDPSNTIAAAVSAVRAGGHIFFFEPFEAGNAVLRLLYTELIERKGELGIPDPVLNMCENMRRDLDLRLGKSIGDPALHHLDDKWFFTRSYFEHQCRKLACSEVIIYALSRDPSPFAEQMKTHLRLCLESGPEIVAEAAWAVVRRYDAMVSASLRDELLLEGAILFRK